MTRPADSAACAARCRCAWTCLAQKTLPLGELLGLRPGDVLPIPLESATVRIQDKPVLKALVVEHKGRLCLTQLQEV